MSSRCIMDPVVIRIKAENENVEDWASVDGYANISHFDRIIVPMINDRLHELQQPD